ncbi:MAG: hypothetical protein NXI23_23365 [Bacteroidetes bacterium]|nr:hypothetical protein [Bacteroidota bacterium]
MKEGLVKDAYELIIKEIQTLLTILYLLMIGIGMLFNYKMYTKFGINIFEYADAVDFLIAPFQDIRIIIVSVVSIIVPMGILWIDRWIQKRFPKTYSKMNMGMNNKSWYKKFRLLSFGLLLLYFVLEASNGYAQFIHKNIQKQDSVSVKFMDNEQISGKMIGKTKEVIFLLTDQKVKVIPITALVKEIEL